MTVSAPGYKRIVSVVWPQGWNLGATVATGVLPHSLYLGGRFQRVTRGDALFPQASSASREPSLCSW